MAKQRVVRTVARTVADYVVDAETLARIRAEALLAVKKELESAMAVHGPMSSPHEGYAVLREEVDELWAEVMRSGKRVAVGVEYRSRDAMRTEAVQVAAMALRFVIDVTGVK